MFTLYRIAFALACARLSDSIVGTYQEQSENKTRTTWKRGQWQREKCLSPAPARFPHFLLLNDFPPPSRSLEQATFAPARKPYKIGLLFTHNNGDLGVVSVMERSCSGPIAKVESHISDRCSYYNWYRYSCRQEKLCGRCSVNIVLTYRLFAVLVAVAVLVELPSYYSSLSLHELDRLNET